MQNAHAFGSEPRWDGDFATLGTANLGHGPPKFDLLIY
jgi:hypothetical protein